MTEKQKAFALLLENEAPYLMHLFDFNKRVYSPEEVDNYLATCSSGEEIMLRFFLGVWRNDNHFQFDFIDAMSRLDYGNKKVIADWANEPFFP